MTRVTQMGVTVAIPAAYVESQPNREALASEVRDLGDQLQPALRHYVGGIQPAGDLATNLAGPVDDPLQGRIYALTLAAPFDADALPADCEAYVAYGGGRGGTTQHDQGPLADPEPTGA